MIDSQTITPDWPVSPAVVAFSTTRHGGVSLPPFSSFNLAAHVGDNPQHVAANRALLEQSLSTELDWQWLNQVHGNEVAIVTEPGPELTADAQLTRRSNLICCIQTADCLPLLVSAIDGTEIAAIHAGWKGLASGVIENTISQMKTPASSLAVWLGPAIGPCHFEVGGEVRATFLAAVDAALVPGVESCFLAKGNHGKYMADLLAIARLKLSALGVSLVSGGENCTHCHAEKFFSYRRDGVTGRMLSAIYIEA